LGGLLRFPAAVTLLLSVTAAPTPRGEGFLCSDSCMPSKGATCQIEEHDKLWEGGARRVFYVMKSICPQKVVEAWESSRIDCWEGRESERRDPSEWGFTSAVPCLKNALQAQSYLHTHKNA
jgi:hypothetical protein